MPINIFTDMISLGAHSNLRRGRFISPILQIKTRMKCFARKSLPSTELDFQSRPSDLVSALCSILWFGAGLRGREANSQVWDSI